MRRTRKQFERGYDKARVKQGAPNKRRRLLGKLSLASVKEA